MNFNERMCTYLQKRMNEAVYQSNDIVKIFDKSFGGGGGVGVAVVVTVNGVILSC